jgi:hypothetical protein
MDNEGKYIGADKSGWFDDPKHVRIVLYALYAACALLLVADVVLYALLHEHPHFNIEKIPGFYAGFGFVAFVVIVLLGKQFRKLVKREEDYYDR